MKKFIVALLATMFLTGAAYADGGCMPIQQDVQLDAVVYYPNGTSVPVADEVYGSMQYCSMYVGAWAATITTENPTFELLHPYQEGVGGMYGLSITDPATDELLVITCTPIVPEVI